MIDKIMKLVKKTFNEEVYAQAIGDIEACTTFIEGQNDFYKSLTKKLETLLKENNTDEIKKDFENLLQNYWYVIRTRECTLLPKEQEQNEKYAKNLMEKWNIT
jgi:DUF438 domain-containing protein